MMLKYNNVRMVNDGDWDELVRETYGNPYCFQQQNGCQSRGIYHITIPSEETCDEEMNDSIPEVINHDSEMGVKFKVWLERDSEKPLNPSDEELKACSYYWGDTEEDELIWKQDKSHISMFYERNFYPDLETIANDLHSKGLIEAGDYIINIDW